MQEKKITDLVIESQILGEHIVNSLDCIGQVSAMHRICSMEKYRETYKTAAHFFVTAEQAMVYRYQIEIAKLFDNHGDTIGFSRFKNAISAGKHLDNRYIEKYRAQHKLAEASINSILERRNNILAHANYAISHDIATYQREHNLDIKQLKKLLEIMLEICNAVIIKYSDGVPELFSYAGNDDFLRLFGIETEAEVVRKRWFGGDAP